MKVGGESQTMTQFEIFSHSHSALTCLRPDANSRPFYELPKGALILCGIVLAGSFTELNRC